MPKTLDDATMGTLRGGSWDGDVKEIRAAARQSHVLTGLDATEMGIGFRCAKAL